MKPALRTLLRATALCACTAGLSGCVGLSVAGIAANLVGGMMGGGGPTQPAEAPSPSRQIAEGLSQIDDRVTRQCEAKLARLEALDAPPLAEASAGPRPWGDPDWSFGGREPRERTRADREKPSQGCAVRPTCLPGMTAPTRMMVCAKPGETASATVAAAAGDVPAQPAPRR